MRITQVFKSSTDGQEISEIEIGGSEQATPVPMVGDQVRWVSRDQVHAGRVISRLIAYSAPDKIGLDRSDEVDMKVVLNVEPIKELI
jgi:hypothetical protein